MNKRLFFFLLVALCSNLNAQELVYTSHRQDSLKVVGLVDKGQYEAAFEFLNLELENLAVEAPKAPFTLWLRAARAYVLDRRSLEDDALKEAMEVVELANSETSCPALIDARLTIALIQEKHELGESCLDELNRVKALLKVCNLPAADSRYHVRKSSYHRWFGRPDSIAYHGKQAVAYGRGSGFLRGELDGNLMLSIANRGKDTVAVYEHINAMSEVSERMGSWRNMLAMKVNLANMKKNHGLSDEALEIVNTIVDKLIEVDDNALQRDAVIMEVYNIKSELLFEKGEYKGAMLALKKFNEAELSNRDKLLNERVKTLEATYQSRLKDEELLQQVQALETEEARSQAVLRAFLLATILALALTYLVLKLRRATRALEEKSALLRTSNKELTNSFNKQVLLRSELHHRVKNNLQVIISLLNIQEHKTEDRSVKDSLRSMSERVYSIAAVHELLYPGKDNGMLNFQDYVRKLCHHSAKLWKEDRKPEFIFDLKGRKFNLDTLVPLGVMISELLTNTRKNFGDQPTQPLISIALTTLPDGLRLTYRDNGPGFATGEIIGREGGMGKYLLRSMSRQLNGSFETLNDEGAVTKISFQVKNNNEEHEMLLSPAVPNDEKEAVLPKQV